MTVRDILNRLDGLDPETEVRFAFQPNWPLEYSIDDIVGVNIDGQEVVYLGQGEQIGYLQEEVVKALSWQ
jgi:hypothetical protein